MTDSPINNTVKPCPCCGDDDVLPYFSDDCIAPSWDIQCDECGLFISKDSEQGVISAWNRRIYD